MARGRSLTTLGFALAGAGALLLGAAVPAAARPAVHTPTARVVVSGLNNPRQVWRDRSGKLFVAEAGKGGTLCSGTGQDEQCIGATGSVARIHYPGTTVNGSFERVVTGLISGAGPDGSFATGADGVSTRNGKIYVQITWAPPDQIPAPLPSEQSGKLLRATSFHTPKIVADVSSVEFTTPNPDGYVDPTTGKPELDSNPYAVLALEGRQLVADAAGNDIIEVRPGHKPRVFAVLPQHGDPKTTDRQPTPTSLANGPDGTILVGELAHEEPGEGRVDVLSSSGRYLGFIGKGGTIADVPGGLTTITGVAYRSGQLYVSQLFSGGTEQTPGEITRISWTKHPTVTNFDVPFPAGIAVDPSRNVFVAAWSIAPSTGAFGAPNSSGQIWRVRF
ncbi:ScyD/ScyE family protein [Aquihabitans sp. McL0605]|uniref:ScyD/ScyE family protein n=1 Tax=Aquihabitans sp. McL0605 TaxID=3415671 RepID=UPI003CEFB320